MKKLIIILSLLFCAVNFAQDLSGVKILIYPYANSADGNNDRSNDNFTKAKFYEKLLKNFGAEVFIIDSRENNLPLSQLAAIVNQNEIDFIHSISDKNFINSEDENYSLVIYNSFENLDIEEAGELILDGIANANRVDNKYLSEENENELSGNFFVGINAPGIITVDSKNNLFGESSYLKNQDYFKNEVWGYIRGLISFYETNPFNKGFIAGVVKEKLDKQITNGKDVSREEVDSEKPINNAKVTLFPGGRIYVGDFNNNGFFFFDSLVPGEYKLIYEAGTYSADSAIVTVASNQTTFADMLLDKDYSIPPSVFNYSPDDTTSKADTESEIKIVFSIPMDQESTEEAFSIEPDIDGEFEWSNEDHVLKFIPESAMDTSSRYEVIIDTSAKGKNNINLEEAGRFYFNTKGRYVEITESNLTEIIDPVITTQRLEFTFSKPMDKDETEDAFEILPVGREDEPKVEGRFEWSADNTKLSFVPDRAYSTSTKYLVIIDKDAETYNGLELGYDYSFEFVTRSSHIHPKIISAEPGSETDTVFINSDITLEFNEPMKKDFVNESFSISTVGSQGESKVKGKFEWNIENTKLRFIPGDLLTPGTNYKIVIANTAVNKYGISLKDNYEFNFNTNNRGRLQLVKNYPASNQKNISTSSKIKLEFNYPVDITILLKNISLFNSGGKEISLTNFSVTYKNDKQIVYCEPASVLSKDTEYNLYLGKDIKDELNIPLLDNIIIKFKTESNISFAGDIVEDFEDTGKWKKLDSNNVSTGIELGGTYFEKSGDKKISGEYSGKIVYKFNKDKSILRLEKLQPLNLFNNAGEAGLWIFGDLSYNIFAVKLINNENEIFDIVVDTLKWSGWRFKKFNLSNFASNNVSLNSILIKRTSKGDADGEVYLDDLQISKTNDLTKAEETIPNEFSLEQNYPNPFNPTTTISFKLPAFSVVNLEVLNILGQKVRNLIHRENYAAGIWSVEWDGKSDYGEFMPSGVYLYKLSAGEFTEVKKMILIK